MVTDLFLALFFVGPLIPSKFCVKLYFKSIVEVPFEVSHLRLIAFAKYFGFNGRHYMHNSLLIPAARNSWLNLTNCSARMRCPQNTFSFQNNFSCCGQRGLVWRTNNKKQKKNEELSKRLHIFGKNS